MGIGLDCMKHQVNFYVLRLDWALVVVVIILPDGVFKSQNLFDNELDNTFLVVE